MLYADQIFLFETETLVGPFGCTLADYMKQTGAEHPSDALGIGLWRMLLVSR